ncbi:unnamed protein product [Ectocarpus sp. 4 AP-2014]
MISWPNSCRAHGHVYNPPPATVESRYEHMPEVRRIAKHRHVPRIVKKAAEAERVQRDKERRKVDNRIKHSKAGTVETVPERKKKIVKELT